jgi:hypothetical protein
MKLSEYRGQLEGDDHGNWLLILCNSRAKRFVNYMTATLTRRDLCSPTCAGPTNHRVVEITRETPGKLGPSRAWKRMVEST